MYDLQLSIQLSIVSTTVNQGLKGRTFQVEMFVRRYRLRHDGIMYVVCVCVCVC